MKLLNILEQDYEQIESPKVMQQKGLTSVQAQKALQQYGKNQLKQKKKNNPIKIFFNQYKDIMTIILLISTVISIFLGEFVEAIAIAVIVLMNGIMGFLQEYKTEKTLEALKKMTAPMAMVYRNGQLVKIKAEDVVPGDILEVETGDRICADAVILQNHSLAAEEAVLTGESVPVSKTACTEIHTNNQLNREDVLYMGTTVVKGHGEVQVIATGMNTQMGSIAGMLHDIEEEETQLQKKLGQLGKYIAIGCLIICVIVSVAGILRGEPILDMLITGVSLAVAAVPEGLPAIVTIALALAVGRMVKRRALVRKLHSVETLGCTTVICSDKTGTLTQNHMTVMHLSSIGKEIPIHDRVTFEYQSTEYIVSLCTLLCNNTKVQGKNFIGEPTEIALVRFAKLVGISEKEVLKEYQRIAEIPFDSKRKCMSVIVENQAGQKYMFTKGAFDVILDKCFYVRTDLGDKVLSADYRKKIAQSNEQMAKKALRVIGTAFKKVNGKQDEREEGLVFLGLIGMIDPPRPEVRDAVDTCKRAGIKTVMITGDHKLTACAIAQEIGIYQQGDLVMEGKELDQINQEQLEQIVDKVSVFARVSPKHKLMIVDAFQKRGNIVAMTGDGVNDAPAIKQADIGVSMGKTGTDVTKEASEIILLDDNFSTLVNAVKEGRVIYSNIRKFIRYLLSCNIGEVITMFLGMLMGMPVVLLPIQILLINLVTDGLPAIALGLEPPEKHIMNVRPRKKDAGIFSDGLLSKIVFRGIFIGLSTLATFTTLYRMTGNVDIGRTGAYFTLIVTQLINVFECKSEQHTLLGIPIFNNPKLIAAAMVSLTILICTIYLSPLQFILNTVSLEMKQILIALSFCMIPSIMSMFLIKKSKKLRK